MQTSGLRVVVTGASRGIGLALARQFHQAGNPVVLVGRDEAALQQAVASLPGAQYACADLSRMADCLQLVARFPDVQVLVNNAGVQCAGALDDLTPQALCDELQTNLLAPMLLTQAWLPQLRQQPVAAVVNVCSVLGWVPKPSAVSYCASKAGLLNFSQGLRAQLAGSSIRVFELVPPLVDTAMTQGRGQGKLSPEQVAAAFWHGWQRDQWQIHIGKARLARLLVRWLPTVARRVLSRS
ncbi:SDR family oxidoreductase [Leeia sp.]|uniref:SDR family oxidoreductase n=1 Tax=Leeia sp. TaxID=2884678 RepID=UPI0035AE586C